MTTQNTSLNSIRKALKRFMDSRAIWYAFVGTMALLLILALFTGPTNGMVPVGLLHSTSLIGLVLLFLLHVHKVIGKIYKEGFIASMKIASEMDKTIESLARSKVVDYTFFSPAEVLDKLSILKLKLEHVGDDAKAKEELTRQVEIGNSIYAGLLTTAKATGIEDQIVSLAERLAVINKEQWEWEDKVRSLNSKSEIAQACLSARNNNNRRVSFKNAINRLFQQAEEFKKYK